MVALTKKYCTTAEAARSLGCTSKHVVWLIHHGHLDGKMWLRSWMVERKSVAAWESDDRRRAK